MTELPDIERMNIAVYGLEAELLKLPQVDINTTNLIHAGMCARTVMIPAGTLLTGAMTLLDNICIVSGDIEVTTNDGSMRLTGFNVIQAKAGIKRIGLAYSDTWWTMVWPTALSDLTAIEDEMSNESEKLQSRRTLEIGGEL